MTFFLNLIDLDKNDLYKLVKEMDDKTTNKISISKFQDVYNAITAESSDFKGIGDGNNFIPMLK